MTSLYRGFSSLFSLHLNCSNGRLPLVRLFLTAHISSVDSTYGEAESTPLHAAAYNGHLHIIQYLCEAWKANAQATTKDGWTVLHCACSQGWLPVVRYLLEKAPNKPRENAESMDGWTCLHCASASGQVHIVKYLVDKRLMDPDFTTYDGWTCLHWASLNGHLPVVKYLLKHADAQLFTKTKCGSTALHCAARSGHNSIVNFIIEFDEAKRDQLPTSPSILLERNDAGVTAWMLACIKGHLRVAQALYNATIQLNEEDENEEESAQNEATDMKEESTKKRKDVVPIDDLIRVWKLYIAQDSTKQKPNIKEWLLELIQQARVGDVDNMSLTEDVEELSLQDFTGKNRNNDSDSESSYSDSSESSDSELEPIPEYEDDVQNGEFTTSNAGNYNQENSISNTSTVSTDSKTKNPKSFSASTTSSSSNATVPRGSSHDSSAPSSFVKSSQDLLSFNVTNSSHSLQPPQFVSNDLLKQPAPAASQSYERSAFRPQKPTESKRHDNGANEEEEEADDEANEDEDEDEDEDLYEDNFEVPTKSSKSSLLQLQSTLPSFPFSSLQLLSAFSSCSHLANLRGVKCVTRTFLVEDETGSLMFVVPSSALSSASSAHETSHISCTKYYLSTILPVLCNQRHSNIAPYLGYSTQIVHRSDGQTPLYYSLREYYPYNLSHVLSFGLKANLSFVLYLSLKILKALLYLHGIKSLRKTSKTSSNHVANSNIVPMFGHGHLHADNIGMLGAEAVMNQFASQFSSSTSTSSSSSAAPSGSASSSHAFSGLTPVLLDPSFSIIISSLVQNWPSYLQQTSSSNSLILIDSQSSAQLPASSPAELQQLDKQKRLPWTFLAPEVIQLIDDYVKSKTNPHDASMNKTKSMDGTSTSSSSSSSSRSPLEYTAEMSEKADVYSFGLLLLEMLSYKQVSNSQSSAADSNFAYSNPFQHMTLKQYLHASRQNKLKINISSFNISFEESAVASTDPSSNRRDVISLHKLLEECTHPVASSRPTLVQLYEKLNKTYLYLQKLETHQQAQSASSLPIPFKDSCILM